jgi:hypothetical protein
MKLGTVSAGGAQRVAAAVDGAGRAGGPVEVTVSGFGTLGNPVETW